MKTLKIGQLAKLSGFSRVTIRYYEECGLLRSKRADNGYRHYDESALQRLQVINGAKLIGLTINEIAQLLTAIDHHTECETRAIKNLISDKLSAIESRIQSLEQLRSTLSELVTLCDGKKKITDCPIIERMKQPSLKSN